MRPNDPSRQARSYSKQIAAAAVLRGDALCQYTCDEAQSLIVNLGKTVTINGNVAPGSREPFNIQGIDASVYAEIQWGSEQGSFSAFVDWKVGAAVRVYGRFVRVLIWKTATPTPTEPFALTAFVSNFYAGTAPLPPTYTYPSDGTNIAAAASRVYTVPPFAATFKILGFNAAAGLDIQGLRTPAPGEFFRFSYLPANTIDTPPIAIPNGCSQIQLINTSGANVLEPTIVWQLQL